MRAIVLERHGGPELLQVVERPDPVAGAGEVVVDVAAVAVNRLDIWVRTDIGHAYATKLPLIPGYDIAGTVRTLGEGATAATPTASSRRYGACSRSRTRCRSRSPPRRGRCT
jgi:NADPH:quinone reductase-like Zn-dependent oxidoreductase